MACRLVKCARPGPTRRASTGLLLGALFGIPAIARGTTPFIPEFYLHFASNSADILPEAMSVIRDAKTYRDSWKADPASPNVWCYVVGGVDGLEFSQGRQSLAMDRAVAVGRALDDLGLTAAERFLTIRKGPQPFVPSQATAAEPFNRTAMIVLYRGMAPIGR